MAAFVLRRRIVLHESDSRMGLANRIASKMSSSVCVGFPTLTRSGKKYQLTGNPIRPEIADGKAHEGYKLTGFKKNLPVLMVWGGSQGAAQINQMVEKDFKRFTKEFQIVHITGKGKGIAKKNSNYVHFEYLNQELKHIYAITDLVVGRAGANSLYELAYLAIPNIIVPLGNADQLGNAEYFESEGAAIQHKNGQELFDLAHNLWQNKALQTEMKKALSRIAKKDASKEITNLLLNF